MDEAKEKFSHHFINIAEKKRRCKMKFQWNFLSYPDHQRGVGFTKRFQKGQRMCKRKLPEKQKTKQRKSCASQPFANPVTEELNEVRVKCCVQLVHFKYSDIIEKLRYCRENLKKNHPNCSPQAPSSEYLNQQ